MRGYPKHLNTKQDIDNLRNDHPEFKEQLRQDLIRIETEPDEVDEAYELIDPKDEKKGYKTRKIPNPNPKWKVLGFKNKGELTSLRNSL